MFPTVRVQIGDSPECSTIGTNSAQILDGRHHSGRQMLPRVGSQPMRLVRLALQAVLFFLLLGAVMGIGSTESGALEKLVFAGFAGVLIWLAVRVREIGAAGPHRST